MTAQFCFVTAHFHEDWESGSQQPTFLHCLFIFYISKKERKKNQQKSFSFVVILTVGVLIISYTVFQRFYVYSQGFVESFVYTHHGYNVNNHSLPWVAFTF